MAKTMIVLENSSMVTKHFCLSTKPRRGNIGDADRQQTSTSHGDEDSGYGSSSTSASPLSSSETQTSRDGNQLLLALPPTKKEEQALQDLMRKHNRQNITRGKEDDGAPVCRCTIEQEVMEALSMSLCEDAGMKHLPDTMLDMLDAIVNTGEWGNKT